MDLGHFPAHLEVAERDRLEVNVRRAISAWNWTREASPSNEGDAALRHAVPLRQLSDESAAIRHLVNREPLFRREHFRGARPGVIQPSLAARVCHVVLLG